MQIYIKSPAWSFALLKHAGLIIKYDQQNRLSLTWWAGTNILTPLN